MSTEQILTVELTKQQLATIISGLLFSCSVNVVSNVNEEYQKEMFSLARELKKIDPTIKLNDIQFLQETNYEDELSEDLLREFVDNMEIVSFDEV
jgi:hypothetical protein